jgi:hypothetical protein
LIALYGKTHKHLHRGSLKAILSTETHLMAHHLIAISEHELIICLLNPQDHNRVQIVTAKRRALDLQTNPSAAPSGSE